MKKLLIILISSCFCLSLTYGQNTVQNVVASSGGTIIWGNGGVTWTLGEVVIATISSPTNIITQGFHQGELVITAIGDINMSDISVLLYPNPATNLINVDIKSDKPGIYKYELIDITGRIIINEQSYSKNFKINIEALKPALYYLRITDKNGKFMKSYKVVKYSY